MFLHVSVIHSVHRGGVPGQGPPGPGTPPWTRYTPWDQVHPQVPGTPPRTRYPLGPGTPPQDQVPPRTRYTPQTRYPPGTRYTPPPGPGTPPPGPGTPPGNRYTPLQSMLGDTVNAWAVRILLECNHVNIETNLQKHIGISVTP